MNNDFYKPLNNNANCFIGTIVSAAYGGRRAKVLKEPVHSHIEGE